MKEVCPFCKGTGQLDTETKLSLIRYLNAKKADLPIQEVFQVNLDD